MKLPRLTFPTITPAFVACLSLVCGIGLSVSGVYVLAGLGWAFIAGAIPMLFLSAVLIRGLLRVK